MELWRRDGGGDVVSSRTEAEEANSVFFARIRRAKGHRKESGVHPQVDASGIVRARGGPFFPTEKSW